MQVMKFDCPLKFAVDISEKWGNNIAARFMLVAVNRF
jgi:hypothetical protein